MPCRSLLLLAVLGCVLFISPAARAQEALPYLTPVFGPPATPEPNPCFEFGCFDGGGFDGDTYAIRGAVYGAIYIYVRNASGNFEFQTYVVNPDLPEPTPENPEPARDDLGFGRPFLLRGDDLLASSGPRVVVFRRWGTRWYHVQTLPFPEGQVTTLARDRDTVVLASTDGNAARVFRQGAWGYYSPESSLPAPSTSDTEFGAALAVHGTTAVVGAPAESARSGAVYIYERRFRRWGLTQTLTPPPELAVNAQFGAAVAVDRFNLAVGAPTAAGALPERRGFVQLHARWGGRWRPGQHIANPLESPRLNTQFGNALALERGLLIAGGSQYDQFGSGDATTFVFERGFRGFSPIARIYAQRPRSVHVSGDYVFVDDAQIRFGTRPVVFALPPGR